MMARRLCTAYAASAAGGAGAFMAYRQAGGAVGAQEAEATIAVATYNVLSPALCRASHFNTCNPEDLVPATRLQRVKDQLDRAEEAGVVCLQEVSLSWAGPLHVYFQKRGYNFVFASYGSAFSNYMGVAIAYDQTKYDVEDIELARVGDCLKNCPKKPERGLVEKALDWLLGRTPPKHPWTEAARRHNQMVLARLQDKASGRRFAVGCYHMPCLFGSVENVQVMTLHAQLAAKKTHKFSAGDPYLLLGDFNIKPDSSTYQLLETGSLPLSHPEVPVHPDNQWSPTITPLRSAYKQFLGQEPLFTNHSETTGPGGVFTGTLDYIWMSEGWQVQSVRPTPAAVPTASFPTAEEPSDHLLISAKLHLA